MSTRNPGCWYVFMFAEKIYRDQQLTSGLQLQFSKSRLMKPLSTLRVTQRKHGLQKHSFQNETDKRPDFECKQGFTCSLLDKLLVATGKTPNSSSSMSTCRLPTVIQLSEHLLDGHRLRARHHVRSDQTNTYLLHVARNNISTYTLNLHPLASLHMTEGSGIRHLLSFSRARARSDCAR